MKNISMKYVQSAMLMLVYILAAPVLAATSAANDINIREPYVRAVPPGQPNSAAFMQLQNQSTTTACELSGLKSPVAERVELHTHLMEDGMMKMRQIKKIDVPAKGKTVLKPGGLHVMFLGLKSELKPGDSVHVTLIYEDGSKKTIQAPVRKMKMYMHHK